MVLIRKFEVSNATRHGWNEENDRKWKAYADECRSRLRSPEDIEKELNEIEKDYIIKDIKVENVDISYHNNGHGNHIELWYTILCERRN